MWTPFQRYWSIGFQLRRNKFLLWLIDGTDWRTLLDQWEKSFSRLESNTKLVVLFWITYVVAKEVQFYVEEQQYLNVSGKFFFSFSIKTLLKFWIIIFFIITRYAVLYISKPKTLKCCKLFLQVYRPEIGIMNFYSIYVDFVTLLRI